MSKYSVEYTDTFGGFANYSWVHKQTIEVSGKQTQAQVMRKAKEIMGLQRMRGRTDSIGEGYQFRPYKSCTILFVDWIES